MVKNMFKPEDHDILRLQCLQRTLDLTKNKIQCHKATKQMNEMLATEIVAQFAHSLPFFTTVAPKTNEEKLEILFVELARCKEKDNIDFKPQEEADIIKAVRKTLDNRKKKENNEKAKQRRLQKKAAEMDTNSSADPPSTPNNRTANSPCNISFDAKSTCPDTGSADTSCKSTASTPNVGLATSCNAVTSSSKSGGKPGRFKGNTKKKTVAEKTVKHNIARVPFASVENTPRRRYKIQRPITPPKEPSTPTITRSGRACITPNRA